MSFEMNIYEINLNKHFWIEWDLFMLLINQKLIFCKLIFMYVMKVCQYFSFFFFFLHVFFLTFSNWFHDLIQQLIYHELMLRNFSFCVWSFYKGETLAFNHGDKFIFYVKWIRKII